MKRPASFIFFISLLAVLGAVFLYRSCQTKAIEMPWGVWEEESLRLQGSPDHLIAQWQNTLSQKDPVALFIFLRDHLQTIPPYVASGNSQKFRWQSYGSLRTGQATSLEKAMLLSEGLTHLGVESNIKYGRLADSIHWKDLYHSPERMAFKTASLNDLSKLQEAYGVQDWAHSKSIQSDSVLHLLSENIYESFKDIHRSRLPNWENISRDIYLVEAIIDSQAIFLNPSFPGAVAGVSYTKNKPLPYTLKERQSQSLVHIKLKASYDDRSYSPFTLAEVKWPLEEVIGKDVRLGFKLLGSPEIILSSPVKSFESFVSTIELLDPRGAVTDSFNITGDVITTRGKVIAKESALNVLAKELESGSANPENAESVTLGPVQLADFPTVLLGAEVKDVSGDPLMNLKEEDFRILINGEQVTHRMVVDRIFPPRILFLYDDSGSMPQEYIRHEKTIEIFQRIVKACHEINPETEFAVSPFGDANTKIHKLSDWSSSSVDLINFIKRNRSGNSHNWSALLGATNIKEANMAILITDADGTEQATEYSEQRFKEGMPGLIYGVLDEYTQAGEFEKMASKTHGVFFNIEDQLPEAMADLQKRVGETTNERYLIEAELENEELPFMDIELQIGEDGPISQLLHIESPKVLDGKPSGKNAITGLYIEISYLNQTFSHKLAGVPYGSNARRDPVTQDIIDECNNALFGEYVLHFEGSSPMPAIVLDEKCQHYLQLKPLIKLLEEADPEQFFKELQQIQWRPDYPGKWAGSLIGNDTTFENAVSVFLYSEFPDKKGQFWQTLDLLSSQGRFVTEEDKQLLARTQILHALKQGYLLRKNYDGNWLDLSSEDSLISLNISPNGRLSGFNPLNNYSEAQDMIQALSGTYVGQARKFIAIDSLKSEIGFLLDYNSFNLTPIGQNGFLAGKKLPTQLDRDGSLVEQHLLWTKTMGMNMDTWMDLEGNKLAYIQLGTIAMDQLGNGVDPALLMEMVKDKIITYIQSEKNHSEEIFFHMYPQWLEAYNISRNNLDAFPLKRIDQ